MPILPENSFEIGNYLHKMYTILHYCTC